jgi:hypothetical protein
VIQETCLQIIETEQQLAADNKARTARRRKIQGIDQLLDEFEKLNLADEYEIPVELQGRVQKLVTHEAHSVAQRPSQEVTITDWMEALYDVQDTLMIPFEDDFD